MLRKILFIVLLAGIPAACGLKPDDPAPTPYPPDYLPTVIYLTAESINSTRVAQTVAAYTPTSLPTFTPSPIPPTPLPSLTPTALPGAQPGAIQIGSPGPMSRAVSPLEVRTTVQTEKNTSVQIALYGEDGGLIYRDLLQIPNASSGEYIYDRIPFQIRLPAEDGILQITTRNGSGVLLALNTVHILLLSSGMSQINPPGNEIYERASLETPRYEGTISGGVLVVRGIYQPVNLQPVILELIDASGKSLQANRVLTFSSTALQSIDTTIPYKVSGPTAAYLVIHQQDDQLSDPVLLSTQASNVLVGPAYLYSLYITLNP
jgi:hypothetical protein